MTSAPGIAPPWNDLSPDQWEALAREHGTPFYLFDAPTVAARIDRVRRAFGNRVLVYYAVKANPNLGLLRAVRAAADGLDISSGGELQQALLAGYDAATMSFAGPAKTDDELADAIRAGVGAISVESLREIDACARIAAGQERVARVTLRVNPLAPAKGYGLKMGGRAVQFGVDEEAVGDAVARLRGHAPHVEPVGVHAYVGSQCFDDAAAADAIVNALRIADEVARAGGWPLRKVNLGGGFGIASAVPRRELDVEAVAQRTLPAIERFGLDHPGCSLLLELGRYITADAGVYVTRVVSAKPSRGKAYAACDGGLNHQLAAAGTFGAALRGNFPVENLTRPHAPREVCQIAGPSCNPTDLLGVDLTLPAPAEGDLLGVLMSGSYGLTASPLLFLGRATPVELVRADGRIDVGRRRHPMTSFN